MKEKQPVFFYDEIYKQNFWFMIGWAEADALSYLKRTFDYDSKGFEGASGKCIEFNNSKSKNVIVIWAEKSKSNALLAGIVAHECIHAANFTFVARNIKYSIEHDETLTYYVERLVTLALGGR